MDKSGPSGATDQAVDVSTDQVKIESK